MAASQRDVQGQSSTLCLQYCLAAVFYMAWLLSHNANAHKLLCVQDLRAWLPASVKAVHLPLVTDADGPAAQDYLIRSQPDAACMSTMEAAARLGSSSPNSANKVLIWSDLSEMRVPVLSHEDQHMEIRQCACIPGRLELWRMTSPWKTICSSHCA